MAPLGQAVLPPVPPARVTRRLPVRADASAGGAEQVQASGQKEQSAALTGLPEEMTIQEAAGGAVRHEELLPRRPVRSWAGGEGEGLKKSLCCHPHQLGHSYATVVRRPKGLDAARAPLGHRTVSQTAQYAELDASLACVVAAELG
jgi:site-specific recombinase XerC